MSRAGTEVECAIEFSLSTAFQNVEQPSDQGLVNPKLLWTEGKIFLASESPPENQKGAFQIRTPPLILES
jgi:hypothetical protein